jgi:hypothetical protein
MRNLREAILRGTRAASRVHRDLGLRKELEARGGRVDVFGIIVQRELPLLFRPLDSLLGVYMPHPMAGILITTKRPLSVQRFTGAHELGHYTLQHQPSLDNEEILHRSPFAAAANYGLQEIEADAFAVEFLLPRWLIAIQAQRHGWKAQDFEHPYMVYQLSLRVGASYDATCRALERYRFITPYKREQLLEVRPQRIKEELLRGHNQAPGWSDVWLLSEHDEGSIIEGGRTDLFILKLLEHSGAGYLWNFDQLDKANFAIVKDERFASNDGDYGGDVMRLISARSKASHSGEFALAERRPWLTDGESLSTLRFTYDLSGPETEGMSKAERKQFWGAA